MKIYYTDTSGKPQERELDLRTVIDLEVITTGNIDWKSSCIAAARELNVHRETIDEQLYAARSMLRLETWQSISVYADGMVVCLGAVTYRSKLPTFSGQIDDILRQMSPEGEVDPALVSHSPSTEPVLS